MGNIHSRITEHGAYTYGYAAASRLTGADNPVLDDERYTYDNVGNRLTASNATGTIEHNANNELRIYGDLHYDYDANGNLTEITLDTQRVFLYVYNTENRLVKVENAVGAVMAEYYYDPFGRRLWKDVGGERTYFFYSDEGLIAEYDASGNEIKTYGWQPDSTWGTDPLWLKQDGEYYFYQNDHLGTPQKLVGVNGAVVWIARYAAFGQAHVELETVTNNLRLPGQYFDAETGLHYNFQRYYDPKVGRYVNADPIGFKGEDVNLYRYAQNNSLRFKDSEGLKVKGCQLPGDTCHDKLAPYCGPDVTQFLVNLVNSAIEWRQAQGTIRALPKIEGAQLYAPAGEQWLLDYGLLLDWQSTLGIYNIRDNKTLICPQSKECHNTVWLCGECVHDHWIGNFMFAYLARLLGIYDLRVDIGGAWIQRGGKPEPPWDTAGYDIARNTFDMQQKTRVEVCQAIKYSDRELWNKANTTEINSWWPFYPLPHAPGYKDCQKCPFPLCQEVENTVPGGRFSGPWPPVSK